LACSANEVPLMPGTAAHTLPAAQAMALNAAELASEANERRTDPTRFFMIEVLIVGVS
jgi:hypothetical protein